MIQFSSLFENAVIIVSTWFACTNSREASYRSHSSLTCQYGILGPYKSTETGQGPQKRVFVGNG